MFLHVAQPELIRQLPYATNNAAITIQQFFWPTAALASASAESVNPLPKPIASSSSVPRVPAHFGEAVRGTHEFVNPGKPQKEEKSRLELDSSARSRGTCTALIFRWLGSATDGRGRQVASTR